MEIISTKPLSLAEVKERFEEREKEGTLTYEQQQAYEHVKKFAVENVKEVNALIKKLGEIKKLSLDSIVKIVDIKPRKAETLKLILMKDKIELSDEEIGEVLKILNK